VSDHVPKRPPVDELPRAGLMCKLGNEEIDRRWLRIRVNPPIIYALVVETKGEVKPQETEVSANLTEADYISCTKADGIENGPFLSSKIRVQLLIFMP
jgi:hypothetical protein